MFVRVARMRHGLAYFSKIVTCAIRQDLCDDLDPMTKNEERPSAKHEDAISNTERGHPAKSSLLGCKKYEGQDSGSNPRLRTLADRLRPIKVKRPVASIEARARTPI